MTTRYEVLVEFGRGDARRYVVDAERTEAVVADAHAWLDDMFVQFECEPPRMSGKVLSMDKVLAVAQAAGPAEFDSPDFAQAYARAAALALDRPRVRVRVDEGRIGD